MKNLNLKKLIATAILASVISTTGGTFIVKETVLVSADEVSVSYKSTTENLNMRTGNSTLYGVILTIPKGGKVEVLSSIGDWDQVIYNGRTGWSSSKYLTASSAPAPTPAAPVQSVTTKTTTSNLNMRTGNTTGYSIILTIPQGAQVEVLASSNGWDQVTYNGKTGWASSLYLTGSSVTAPAPAPAPAPTPTPVQSTTYKSTTYNLNMRTGNSTGNSIILTIPQGAQVEVLATLDGWAQVIYSGKTGWVSAQYLTESASSFNGQDVVDYAKNFIGIEYTWGGNTPEEGFDCSGLVKYVYAHYGITTPRVSRNQAEFGEEVSMNALQPGDLVYFGNGTVSHIGIYVSGNNMLHAPAPGRDVEIKDMSWHRSYYSTVGARRYIK